MLRRNIRLRKEYLYLKKIEEEKKQYAEKIKSIKESYEKNKKIKSHLKNEENELRKKMDLYDEKSLNRNFDDEYFFCGIENPRVLITTSRNPSSQLENFAKEIKLLIPNSEKINRGSYFIKDIINFARKNNITDVIIIHEYKGIPRNLIICHLPFGPTLFCTIKDCKMRHEFSDQINNISMCNPHLIFHNFNSDLGKRIMNIFKYLFPPVKIRTNKRKFSKNNKQISIVNDKQNKIKEESEKEDDENELEISIKNSEYYNLQKFENNRIITFFNKNDIIYFRHYNWNTNEKNEIILNEMGPRFSFVVYKINKETLDSLNEDYEYVYRPFLNSKKTLLS
ncbi:U3 small nucleolar ribonucleoprotein protein, putative [Plasmodium gallinaceum]|uniref:U3 small nucleolar ribonucleoprotein protein, putative n=1 Tax=Plasmodium gallinaceum TaxID=5849 RepID=A0A1J1GM29_PLAGA|nr:U3 small nucleolar ribonucleoprotein protein, putative [Plasmodium gallinaceum]CRG93412.1 U3 small nucleolar ribonucleoprotein protein, putative [Plasmodium gallinaceum]